MVRIMGFGDDFVNTVPRMVVDYWYLLLLFFGLIFILYRILRWSRTTSRFYRLNEALSKRWWNLVFRMLALVMLVIGFRGGLQYRPLSIGNAAQLGGGHTSALILNTPFTIIKTWGKMNWKEPNGWMTRRPGSYNHSRIIRFRRIVHPIVRMWSSSSWRALAANTSNRSIPMALLTRHFLIRFSNTVCFARTRSRMASAPLKAYRP